MRGSSSYKELNLRKEELTKRFLEFDQNNSHFPENQDKLRAFKLLIHAEIESYIEKVSLMILDKCSEQWKSRKKVLPSLRFLIMYSSTRFEAHEKQLTSDDRINQILSSYENIVNTNNGIRKKNILQLVIPLGIQYDDIDQTWLTTIESYGNFRGMVAHKSSSVQKQIDKNDELRDVEFILKGLKELDIKLRGLNSKLRMPY